MDFIKIDDIDHERFYKLPKMLFLNKKYKGLSVAAKVVYGIIKDRMELSKQSGWKEPDGRVYVFFKQAELADFLGVTDRTIRTIFSELKKVGLLETEKQSLGKPAKVYLMKVDSCEDEVADFASDGKNLPHGQEENFLSDRKEISYRIGSQLPSIETEGIETEDSDTSKEEEDKDWQEVLKAYQDNIRPIMGSMELEKLRDLFDSFKKTWVIEAIREAVERNARSLKYMTAILEQWHRDGFKVDSRKKGEPSKKKTKGYSQDEYAKVLEKMKGEDSNAGNG